MHNSNQNKYVGPFIIMVFLFFIVGFLTSANAQFQGPLKEAFLGSASSLKNTLATLITFSWFLAYPIAGNIGSKWVRKYAYKGTLTRGLVVMVVGLVFFWLSSYVTVKYPMSGLNLPTGYIPIGFLLFLCGSFIAGASATILQVVLNPYLSACSVPGTQAVQRLAIGGSANSIGTTIAPYFVTGIVFGGVAMEDVLIEQLSLPFLILSLSVLVLFFMLLFVNLPDIDGTKEEKGEQLTESIWSFSHLSLGVIAIFFYVGAEVCIGANINMHAIELGYNSPALLATIYWGGMLIGRLAGSSLRKITPKMQLISTSVAAFFFTLFALIFNNLWILSLVGLFHSIMWGAIYTLSVNKLGKYTNMASGVFMIGVIGGAIFPLVQGLVADIIGGWRYTWSIVLICEIYMLYYALWGSKVKKGGVAI